MTSSAEMTQDEVCAHGLAIAAAKTEGEFVSAFAAYARAVVERETDPYEKIALFVHGMIEGQREMIVTLSRYRGGGAA